MFLDLRHPGEGLNPELNVDQHIIQPWTPAFAGATNK